MSEYEDGFARYYDLFYSDKPYDEEVRIVDRLLREYADGPSERLLDVACGTGRHAAGFAAGGWRVVGVDRSSEMLRQAAQRVEAAVELITGDMRALELPAGSFDAATCLFDSIGYALTNAGILATLAGIRAALRSGGLLALEFWHAPPMLTSHDPVRVREWSIEGGTILRVSSTSLDIVEQAATVQYTIHRLGADGRYRTWSETHRNRYFHVQEMALLLDSSGFEPLRWLAGFDTLSSIGATTWHVVVLARRDDDGG